MPGREAEEQGAGGKELETNHWYRVFCKMLSLVKVLIRLSRPSVLRLRSSLASIKASLIEFKG